MQASKPGVSHTRNRDSCAANNIAQSGRAKIENRSAAFVLPHLDRNVDYAASFVGATPQYSHSVNTANPDKAKLLRMAKHGPTEAS